MVTYKFFLPKEIFPVMDAAASDQTRYAINGVNFARQGNLMFAVATDGKCLNEFRWDSKYWTPDGEEAVSDLPENRNIVVPLPVFKDVQKVVSKTAKALKAKACFQGCEVHVLMDAPEGVVNEIQFIYGVERNVIKTAPMEGVFPKWRDVIPVPNLLNRDFIHTALDRELGVEEIEVSEEQLDRLVDSLWNRISATSTLIGLDPHLTVKATSGFCKISGLNDDIYNVNGLCIAVPVNPGKPVTYVGKTGCSNTGDGVRVRIVQMPVSIDGKAVFQIDPPEAEKTKKVEQPEVKPEPTPVETKPVQDETPIKVNFKQGEVDPDMVDFDESGEIKLNALAGT